MANSHQYASALFELHELELTLSDVAKKTAQEKQREVDFAAAIKARAAQREKQDVVLKTAQVAAKNLELELEDLNAKKKKKENQVLMATNPRELDAVNAEIARLAGIIPEKEMELLEVYERVEKAQAAVHASDEDQKKRHAHVPKLKADVAKNLKDLDEKGKAATAKLAEVEPTVDAASLEKYRKARKKHDVPVLFSILENACGGCGLPRADYEWNKLRSNPGNVYECSDCQRLNVFTGEVPP